MAREYVEERGGAYYVAGSRVSLDSVVHAFLRGEPPEGIADSFPAIDLERVYGAIAYHLAHRPVIDDYLERSHSDFARLREESRRKHPQLYAKLAAARQAAPGPSRRRPRFQADADLNQKISGATAPGAFN